MLFDYIRLFKDTGALSDVSIENQDDAATVSANLTNSQYFYIAQKMPFTNLFMWVNTPNNVAASWDVEYWDGTAWRNAVDILDSTKDSNGHLLSKSGILQFTLDDDYSWQKVYDTADSGAPTELSGLRVFDCYWLRLRPTASLHASTTLKEVTYAFTHTQELSNFDVEIAGYLASFETGKTDWIKEIITASKLVVLDFRRLGLIVHQGQIVELTDVSTPCALRTLMLIYSNLGPSYKDKIAAMKKEYDNAMNIRRFTLDYDKDGRISSREQTGTIKRLVR